MLIVLLTLHKPRNDFNESRFDGGSWSSHSINWKKAAPFWFNPRAILIHRPKAVLTLIHEGLKNRSYPVVDYWCGGHAIRGDAVRELPQGKLLCERCEYEAVRNGLPPADEILGRHIHIGWAKAVQTCCH